MIKTAPDFWFGLAMGILGGTLGDIWVTLWYRWMDNKNSSESMTAAIISTITIFLFIMYLFNKAFKKEKK